MAARHMSASNCLCRD